jgi:NitT/TauT family transport system substrate-binding protein
MSRQTAFRALLAIVIIAVGSAVWFALSYLRGPAGPASKISIGTIPFSFTGYSVYIAKEKGYFRENGLDVTLKKSYPHGKATLQALAKGEVEFAVSSETPFMHCVLNGEEVYALATMINADKHLGVVARKDSGIFMARDLKGKKIGVTLGSNGEYFLDMVLLLNGISRDEIIALDLKPKEMPGAVTEGRVDAIAAWNPQMFRAMKELGDNAVSFFAKGLYLPSFIISSSKNYADNNPDIVEKVILSLIDASDFINKDPDQSNKIVARYLNTDKSVLDELSSTYYFNISLEQSLLLTLEHQSRWAIKNGLTRQTATPDYLDFIYTQALENVKPESVRIIK